MVNCRNKLNRIVDGPVGVVLLVIVLLFMQMPYFFAVMPAVNASVPYVRWGLIVVLGVFLLIQHGNVKSLLKGELLLWGCVLWSLVLCISMRINGKGLHDVAFEIIPMSLLAVLTISVFTRVNARRFLFVLFFYFLVINTLNNVSVLLFVNNGIPVGTFSDRDPEYIFFGHINEGIICGVNSILFGFICAREYGKEWDIVNVVNLVFSLITAWAVSCEAQLITYAAAAVALLICYGRERVRWLRKVTTWIMKWVSLKTIMIFNMLVFVAVVLLGNTGWMEKVGINSNLHSRRELWNTVLASIGEHPVIGLGYTSWIIAMMRYGAEKTFWHQHSIYLMIMYETGIVGTLIFAAMFVLAIWCLDRMERLDTRFLISVVIGVFFLAMVIEVCIRSEIFLLLAVCCYLPKVIGKNQMEQNQMEQN